MTERGFGTDAKAPGLTQRKDLQLFLSPQVIEIFHNHVPIFIHSLAYVSALFAFVNRAFWAVSHQNGCWARSGKSIAWRWGRATARHSMGVES